MKYIHLLIVLTFFCTNTSLQGQDYTQPQAYGGNESVKWLLTQELIYPEQALDAKLNGQVMIYFTVEENGKTTDVRVAESVHPELSKEALRLFHLICWEPARYKGKAVRGQSNINIKFNIRAYKRMLRERGYTTPPFPYRPIDSSGTVYSFDKLSESAKPIYPDDCKTLADFYKKHLEYPEIALKRGLSGKVEIELIIEPSGRSSNMRILNQIGGGCDEEALRLARQLRWLPGKIDGVCVRSNIKINIIFALPKDTDYKYFPTHQGTSM